MSAPPHDAGSGWLHPDRRGLAATALGLAGVAVLAGVPTVLGIARGTSLGVALAWVAPIALVVIAGGVLVDLARVALTTYRVTGERFELRTRHFGTRVRALPRERIRAVDLTADPVSRVLGLVSVRVATGEQGSAPMTLSTVRAEVGEALRDTLLDRRERRPDGTAEVGLLAAVGPGWAAAGVLSVLTPAMAAAAVGGAFTVAGWFDATDAALGWAGGQVAALTVPVAAVVAALLLLLVGAAAALGLSLEAWWRHRLSREPDGSLRVTRGLLTTRSVSVQEIRLRGVELVEPLGVRLAGGARVDALLSGTTAEAGEKAEQDATLLPAVPRATALTVAAAVLRNTVLETATPSAHPVAARRRRVVRALAATAVVVAALLGGAALWPPLLLAAGVTAALGVPASLAGARASYRALGHALTDTHLVIRHGAVRRTTTVLRRDAVIGWTVRSSVTQRRVGLVTLWVTTATRGGACVVRDVGEADALALVGAVGGDAVAPWLASPTLTAAGSGSSTSPPPPGGPGRR